MTHNHNLFEAFRQAFESDPQALAVEVIDGPSAGLCLRWCDLDEASARMANLLESLGLSSGARIAVQVEKSVESLILYLAVLRAGFVYLPLNTAYQQAEVTYFIENAEPEVVVCSPERHGWVSQRAFAAGTRYVFTLGEDRRGSLLERASHHNERHTPAGRSADDLAVIIYTSGTTGRSKGAMLTHGNMRSNAWVLRRYWDWRADDVLIHALPIFHVHGLFVAIHGALIAGRPMLWLNRFDPKAVVALLPRATVFMGVPTLYVRMLAEAGLTRDQARAMRLFISGSAPLLIETFQAWQARTGHTILERYGMSETIMLTSNPCTPDDRHAGAWERRGGTVGFALPGVELRLVDEHGAPVPAGEVGAIQVRGPGVFKGYWRMPEKTAEDFTPDGFFLTGDVGRLDADAYLTLVGRSKDLLISGGYNVYPAEVEGHFNALPGVAESAVVGAPHPDFGEAGVVFVVPQHAALLDGAALLAELKGRLASYKVPKRCLVVDSLPRNAMGKVQKNLLRQQVVDSFMPG